MYTDRKRQQSLKELPALKKHETFPRVSVKILPTIQEYREDKKSKTKDLTQVISKFTNNNQKHSEYSQQLIRSALAVLKSFSEVQNNFQSLFAELYPVFKRFIFSFEDKDIQPLLSQFKIKQGFTYRKSCMMLGSELQNVMKGKNQRIKQLTAKNIQLVKMQQTQRQSYTTKQKQLQQKVEYYIKLANIEYMRSLEEKVQYLTLTINDIETQNTKLNKQKTQFLRQIDLKDSKIEDQTYQIAKLRSDLFDTKKELDKVDLYFHQMRDRFDQLLVKMMGIKQVIQKVEEQNNLLVTQRMKMVNRAAVAFNDLTPRPDYSQFYGTVSKSSSLSTKEIFAALANQQGEQQKKAIIQKMKAKRKVVKLSEVQAVRDKIVDDIIIAKKQMDKLQK